MRATAAPEEGNKVRLSVEVDEAEVAGALDEVFRRLSREIRVPGFRPGKVPRRVLEARMGGVVAMREEALREALPEFYAQAVVDTAVEPIDRPEIDITAGSESGPVTFDAVVEVRPTVAIPGVEGLVVTLPTLEVSDEDVDDQIDRLRATSGELVAVERAVAAGDQVTIGIRGERSDPVGDDADLVADDYLYEVGSAGVVPELDDRLLGAHVGDTVTFESVVGPDDAKATFTVTVTDVKELILPDADDAWAEEASEFETLKELRGDISRRLAQVRMGQARVALERRALDALVDLVAEDVPERMVAAELSERLHDLDHRLEQQGIPLRQFLAATGRDEQAFLDEFRAEAIRGVKADLALRALADQEGIELTDDELTEELVEMGAQMDRTGEQVRGDLERAGRLPAVRSERRKAKALRWLLDNVELVDEEGHPVSRDALALDQPASDQESSVEQAQTNQPQEDTE